MLPTGPTLLRATAVTCGVILIAAVGYVQWQARHAVVPETAQKVNFLPAPSTLGERAKLRVNTDVGAGTLSTTLPVETGYQPIPFGQGLAVSAPSALNASPPAAESDADVAGTTVPVKGAYLVRFSNAQLCDAEGRCPIALMAQAEGAELVQGTLLQINAKNIYTTSHLTNGNPDLIVDYGGGVPPIRMVWSTEGEYPSYQPVPPSAGQPLPELK